MPRTSSSLVCEYDCLQPMTNSRKFNVGLVQMRMGADPEANFAAAVEHIREAARLGVKIV